MALTDPVTGHSDHYLIMTQCAPRSHDKSVSFRIIYCGQIIELCYCVLITWRSFAIKSVPNDGLTPLIHLRVQGRSNSAPSYIWDRHLYSFLTSSWVQKYTRHSFGLSLAMEELAVVGVVDYSHYNWSFVSAPLEVHKVNIVRDILLDYTTGIIWMRWVYEIIPLLYLAIWFLHRPKFISWE